MAVTVAKCRVCGGNVPVELDDTDEDDGFRLWATQTRPGFGIRCNACVNAGRK